MFLKIRLRICRLIVIVSIIWFLIGLIFLYNYFDSLMDSRWLKENHEGSQSVFSAYQMDSINNHQQNNELLPISSNYQQYDMLTWQPAPIVKPNRNSPGEMGKAVHIPVELEDEMKENFKKHQFNIMASDRIALNRSLEDVRLEACKTKIYSKYLPTTSIVIVFHNEAWSTLLRTVWSVINRSPKTLLKEVILVDDASLLDHLGKDLENYVATLPVPVHVYRTGNRSGLIRARLLGAEKAKGRVMTFLDAHCECTEGWLEPLLERIAKNRKTVACPIIDVISDNDFEYVSASDMTWGGFNWKLNFRWYRVPKREMDRRNNDRTEPLRTPTMAGGLFAIEKDYFYEIGSYDKGMDIWGGENLEMSFRIWQCGGILEIIPCSRVGHVFRDKSPYSFPGGVSQIIFKNSRRVAEVWMDVWKDFYYAMTPAALSVNVGNITERLLLRQKLQCKDFKWYLENIYPESHLPLNYYYLGDIKSDISDTKGAKCIDTMGRKSNEKVGFSYCHNFGGNQVFSYTMDHQIMSDDNCLDASSLNDYVLLIRCHGARGNQAWDYNRVTRFIKKMNTNYCLEKKSEKDENVIILSKCDIFNINQKWTMQNNFKWQINQSVIKQQ